MHVYELICKKNNRFRYVKVYNDKFAMILRTLCKEESILNELLKEKISKVITIAQNS